MTVVFSDSDWTFIEARLLRHPQYKDPEVFAKASQYVRWWVNRLVNELYPIWVEKQTWHVSAEDEAKARASIIKSLDDISHKIERWKNLPESSSFFVQVEYEVQMEMDRPAEYLELEEGASSIEAIPEIYKQQPGNFHDFEFSFGTLLALIKWYQRGADRAEKKRLAYKSRYSGNYRNDTITHETFAMNLAVLWEEMTGESPKVSNNSGFRKLISKDALIFS